MHGFDARISDNPEVEGGIEVGIKNQKGESHVVRQKRKDG
jgi:hypothetical protein